MRATGEKNGKRVSETNNKKNKKREENKSRTQKYQYKGKTPIHGNQTSIILPL